MTESFDLLIRGATCATGAGLLAIDIGVRSGRIAAIDDLSRANASETFEARGRLCRR